MGLLPRPDRTVHWIQNTFDMTMSGLPGRSPTCNRYLNPSVQSVRLTYNFGRVSLLRTRDISRERASVFGVSCRVDEASYGTIQAQCPNLLQVLA